MDVIILGLALALAAAAIAIIGLFALKYGRAAE